MDLTPRPTTYNGVRMRSRLEAAYAEQFDAFGWEWQYEPQCFGTQTGQYLPDFLVTDRTGAPAYAEVKPIIDREQVSHVFDESVRWCKVLEANRVNAFGLLICFGANRGRVACIAARVLYQEHNRKTFKFLAPVTPPVPSLHAGEWLALERC